MSNTADIIRLDIEVRETITTTLCFGDSFNCYSMLIDTGSPITWIPTVDCYYPEPDEDGGAWLRNHCYTGGIANLLYEMR